ncbi:MULTISPECIES: type II toxin-antitoxin system VapC family toxin [unclassified Saccharothrix]|uniref:type II toxin-antitoxin system VapC family toxin n=1 Tax=unclassified Saccharothrix TaxID=2593673 RepID=UPI00307CD537
MSFFAVVDNSALIEFLLGKRPHKRLVQTMLTGTLAAPELLDAEAFSVLRRMVLHSGLPADEAYTHLRTIRDAPITRVGHRAVMDTAWDMRNALSAHDSFYVALADRLGVPLITCDAKLAGSNGHSVEIELFAVS